ncbi:hypothetical protein ABH944_004088 [Caballeronia udeis]|uniref:Uncharacterized protein n=1 Tax=Caballeronia udeis TaxID=1232866 RepID=A0ABW8MLH6_9BURK
MPRIRIIPSFPKLAHKQSCHYLALTFFRLGSQQDHDQRKKTYPSYIATRSLAIEVLVINLHSVIDVDKNTSLNMTNFSSRAKKAN